ncbi:MAG TPA: ImmA/IrrE family metallo-endopeptidase [Terriglobales bacterium]|jgi:Zn-dependent peptidase ImmA (M78 family)|nr:ImmA/IrrE family metallo-endopeptidase [Terriglobales bacterium]
MRQLRQTIRKRVSELLRENGIVRSPVPVEKIAQKLGIDVRFEDAEDDLSGALIRKPKGRVVIGVNSAHHPNRQRFTIAHEIGHFVLHKGIKLHVDEDFRINLRDGSVNDEEIDANAFAAELLMPTELIGRDIQKLGRIDQEGVEKLALRYRVSSRAMEIRLTNLGLRTPL